jgi:hypothetical protein
MLKTEAYDHVQFYGTYRNLDGSRVEIGVQMDVDEFARGLLERVEAEGKRNHREAQAHKMDVEEATIKVANEGKSNLPEIASQNTLVNPSTDSNNTNINDPSSTNTNIIGPSIENIVPPTNENPSSN